MSSHDLLPVHTGTVIEDDSLTLEQLCRACGVHEAWVISLVEESIIEPQGGDEVQVWRFSGASLVRVRFAQRLQRDLGINMAGIALALDLMDELENLRAELKKMGRS